MNVLTPWSAQLHGSAWPLFAEAHKVLRYGVGTWDVECGVSVTQGNLFKTLSNWCHKAMVKNVTKWVVQKCCGRTLFWNIGALGVVSIQAHKVTITYSCIMHVYALSHYVFSMFSRLATRLVPLSQTTPCFSQDMGQIAEAKGLCGQAGFAAFGQ